MVSFLSVGGAWWVLVVDRFYKACFDVLRLGGIDVKQAVKLGLDLAGMAWAGAGALVK